MAAAKKCDICGELYEEYNTTLNKEKPNGVIFCSADNDHKYYGYGITDCCPGCMDSIKKHIDSLKEGKK